MKVSRDVWIVFQRHLLLMVRSPLWVFLGVAQPVVYMALFAPLLKPALASLDNGSMAAAYRIYIPGMLVALALGGGLYVGFGLLAELSSGVIERARVTPISRIALLLGRALRDVVTLAIQAAIIILLSLPLGLFVHVGDLLLAYALLALISLTSSAISYGIALEPVQLGGFRDARAVRRTRRRRRGLAEHRDHGGHRRAHPGLVGPPVHSVRAVTGSVAPLLSNALSEGGSP
jgi:ABC-2 type transport system permease protein